MVYTHQPQLIVEGVQGVLDSFGPSKAVPCRTFHEKKHQCLGHLLVGNRSTDSGRLRNILPCLAEPDLAFSKGEWKDLEDGFGA